MARVLISGWFGHGNIGDEAILESVIESISSSVPHAKIIVFSVNPAHTTKHHHVPSMNHHQSLKRPISYVSTIKELLRSDVFILGGGGFLSDWQSPDVPEIWLKKPLLARRLGSKVMAFGIGAGPITTDVGKKWARKALNEFDAITVRDRTSKKVLIDAGVSQHIEVTADPALLLIPSEEEHVSQILSKERIPPDQDYAGIALTPVFHSETLWPGCREKCNRFRDACLDLIQYITTEMGLSVILLPMDKSIDLQFLESLTVDSVDRTRIHTIRGSYQPRDVLGLIGRLKLLMANRFHSVMFGAMARVPTIGISIHHKISDFLRDAGLGPCTFPLGDGTLMNNVDLDVDEVKACIDEQLSRAPSIRQLLEERIVHLERRARRNNEVLVSLALGEC